MTTQHPTAVTPEGHRIGAGMAEWMHGIAGPLDLDADVAGEFTDGIFRDEPDESAVCEHGKDDYCRPCNVRARADERYLGL